jgi:integrase
MTQAPPCYCLELVQVECLLQEHLAAAAEYHPHSRTGHRRLLRLFVEDLSESVQGLPGRFVLSEPRLVQWMIQDCRGRAITTACVRLGRIGRFVKALCRAGLTQENVMAHWRARHGDHPWAVVVAALQAADPQAALAALPVEVRTPGPLTADIHRYVELQHALGKQYVNQSGTLLQFDRFLQTQAISSLAAITPALVERWLESLTCRPRGRRIKAGVLQRFCAYLVSLGRLSCNPVLPSSLTAAKQPDTSLRPFIFSVEEMKAVLAAARKLPPSNFARHRPQMCYTMLVLLYTLGLRLGEVLRLRIGDVDLVSRALFIHESKFHKSRYVPFGAKVGRCLEEFLALRHTVLTPIRPEDPLFVTLWRAPVRGLFLRTAFHGILANLELPHRPGCRRPRIHDARHSFAVNRLLRWYRDGGDVQSRLPLLSTFMGHVELRSTEVYLTITQELLQEANRRFYQHFGAVVHEEIPT